jgi:hypothetical protein
MEGGRLGEESFQVDALRDLLVQARRGIARQPADDLVDFGLRAVLALRLLDIHRIHLGEGGRENAVPGHRQAARKTRGVQRVIRMMRLRSMTVGASIP